MSYKVPGYIAVLIFNLLIIGFAIVALELAFGDWLGRNRLNKLNIVKNTSTTHDVSQLYKRDPKTITYTRDQYGLRGQFDGPRAITFLTIGGSTTDQRYIADGETWQDVFQEELAAAGKKGIVANAGVDGQSTYGHIKNFDWWFPFIPDLKPRYVLFYVGLNDFYVDEGNGFDALGGESADPSLLTLLRERSALYHLGRTLNGLYLALVKQNIGHGATDFEMVEWTTEPLHDSYDEMVVGRFSEYAERLEILVRKTQEFGAQPIFMTQPARKYRRRKGQIEGIKSTMTYEGAVVNGVDFYRMMRKLDGITEVISLKYGIRFIDLAQDGLWDNGDFYDTVHMTPQGARKVGLYLYEDLKESL
jgi:hypothetical protein